jgi:hypothetical protein
LTVFVDTFVRTMREGVHDGEGAIRQAFGRISG